MLVIACGNRDRSDDGAGILVAEGLRGLGIKTRLCPGVATELIEAWSGIDDVVVVDCVVTGASPGTVHLWDASHPPAFGKRSSSTHGFGLAEAVELARALGQLPAKLQIYGIEGKNFHTGGAVSPEVNGAIAEVVNRIAAELARGE